MRNVFLFFLIFFISFPLIIVNDRSLKTTTSPCNLGNFCLISGGSCMGAGTGMVCVCFSGYATFPEGSNIKCNYSKYSQQTAFLYELVIPFGGGHYYSARYNIAITKCIFFAFGVLLILLVRLFSKNDEDYSVGVVNLSAASLLVFTAMLIWHCVDLYYFGFNMYMDGNGILMLPWGADPSYLRTLVIQTTTSGLSQQNTAGPPGNMIGQPGNMMGPPGNMTGQPGNMTGPPSNMTGQPGNMTGPPSNMTGQPGNMTGPPSNMTGQPGNMTGTPTQH